MTRDSGPVAKYRDEVTVSLSELVEKEKTSSNKVNDI